MRANSALRYLNGIGFYRRPQRERRKGLWPCSLNQPVAAPPPTQTSKAFLTADGADLER
jgi:hypothetical protein